jgi:hypothetical protein
MDGRTGLSYILARSFATLSGLALFGRRVYVDWYKRKTINALAVQALFDNWVAGGL